MNEEVEKTISDLLNGFYWTLGGIVIVLILYLIFKTFIGRRKDY